MCSASRPRAPAWAIPVLSAYLVARSQRSELRRLDDAAFRRVSRGCDLFMAVTTGGGLTVSSLLLPATAGVVLLLASSVWGLANILLLGRALSDERRRRLRRRSP